MSEETRVKEKTGCRKDLKWIVGLLLFLTIIPTLFGLMLYRVTEQETAVETMTILVASVFSRNGLDDANEIEQARRLIRTTGGTWKPIPGLDIELTEADLEGTPREARLRLFRKLTEPLYLGGEEALLALTTNQDLQEEIAGNTGMLTLLSAKSHQTIGRILLPLSLATAALLMFFVFVSAGFARLGNPGLVLALAAFPGALLSVLARAGIRGSEDAGSLTAAEGMDMIGEAMRLILPIIQPVIRDVFLSAFLLGLGLILIAIAGRLLSRARRGRRHSETPDDPHVESLDNDVG